jgi:hypothetical protein
MHFIEAHKSPPAVSIPFQIPALESLSFGIDFAVSKIQKQIYQHKLAGLDAAFLGQRVDKF